MLDDDKSLYDRAVWKLTRINRNIDEGLAKPKDRKEVAKDARLKYIIFNFLANLATSLAPFAVSEENDF